MSDRVKSTSLLPRLSLPLLTKELAEQSSRPRTYILRAGYALVLYSAVLLTFSWQMKDQWARGPLAMLGSGQTLFLQVVWGQLATVCLFLPALMAGVVTSEKERDTLGLLLITKLSPLQIVVQKYLSRIIPILLYLGLSLPLLGVAYSLGGVQLQQIFVAAWLLLITTLTIGAVGVLASVWCRTTAQSLAVTYAATVGIGWFAVTVINAELMSRPQPVMPPALYATPLQRVVWPCLPTLVLLYVAAQNLWGRAFLSSGNYWLKLLQAVDQFFQNLNQNSVTKGIVLIRDEQQLPAYAPIAWRETQKKSLGTVRYLVRLLLIIELPLLFLILLPLTDNIAWERGFQWLDLGSLLVWWVAIFAILASSTALFATERAHQTLDVLLSTPLSAQEIIREKFTGVRRMIMVLWVPMATVLGFRLWWMSHVTMGTNSFGGVGDVVSTLLAAIIYPPLIGWIGVHASLRCRSQVAAMTVSLLLIVGIASPPLLVHLSEAMGEVQQSRWLSFMMGVLLPGVRGASLWHFVLYAGLWYVLRRLAPLQLVQLTGRCEAAIPGKRKLPRGKYNQPGDTKFRRAD